MKNVKMTFSTLLFILGFNFAFADSAQALELSCENGKIMVTYEAGTWPFSSEKATFIDQTRRLKLSSNDALPADTYDVPGWTAEADIVFQFKTQEPDYIPYALVLNAERMEEAYVGETVSIGFRSSFENKFKKYKCMVVN